MGQFDFTSTITGPIKLHDHHTRHEDEGADEMDLTGLNMDYLHITSEVAQAFKAEYNIITDDLATYVHGVKVELTRATDIQPSNGCWFGGQFVLNAGSSGYTALDKPAYVLQAIFKGSDTSPNGTDIHVGRFETQSAGKVSDILYVTANSGTTITGSLEYIATHVAPSVSMLELNAQSSVTVPTGIKVESGSGSSYNYGIDLASATINTADIRFQGGTTLVDDGTTLKLTGANLDINNNYIVKVRQLRGCDDHHFNIYANATTGAAAEKDMIFWTLNSGTNTWVEIFRCDANGATPTLKLAKGLNANSQSMTNVNIDSGTMSGITLDGAIAGGGQNITNLGDVTVANLITAGNVDGVDVSVHATTKAANATLGHVIVETGSSIDVDGDGKIVLGDISGFLEDTPTDNETGKAPTSNWAVDHAADVDAHGLWLSGWDNRIKLTIDSDDIDDALSDFPILVYLSADSGTNDADVSAVFDELTLDANRKKIAVTTSDGITECYVEIEKWDDGNEKAWLWVKVPSISSSADTVLYLYYDVNHADNTTYVGDPNSEVAENVWDSNFKHVCHMRDDPDTSHTRDSTDNDTDGTKKGANEPAVTTSGRIADAQNFAGDDDKITLATESTFDFDKTDPFTLECWIKTAEDAANTYGLFSKYTAEGVGYFVAVHTGKVYFQLESTGYKYKMSNTGVADDAWHHIVVTSSGSALLTGMNIYRDGVDNGDAGVEDGVLGSTLNNESPLIGFREGAGVYFNGIIDEVRASSSVRNAAWVKASYESGRDDLIAFGSEETWLFHHAAFHQDGGADEISIAGLAGESAELTTHKANTTTAHGAVSAATASKHVVRDASARAKFAAPSASGDVLIKGTRVTTAELPAMTDERYWVGTGTNVEERAVPTTGAPSGAGSYEGDDSANRAVPHGLGATPKIVFILRTGDASRWFRITGGSNNIYNMESATPTVLAVTAMDATNFYVGNAASYFSSANSTGVPYDWVAIG